MALDEGFVDYEVRIRDLKAKYKKKCAKVRELNQKLKRAQEGDDWSSRIHHRNYLKVALLEKITAGLDLSSWDIEYEYDGSHYREEKVKSFGARWLKYALLIHLSEESSLSLRPYEIKIINATKLY